MKVIKRDTMTGTFKIIPPEDLFDKTKYPEFPKDWYDLLEALNGYLWYGNEEVLRDFFYLAASTNLDDLEGFFGIVGHGIAGEGKKLLVEFLKGVSETGFPLSNFFRKKIEEASTDYTKMRRLIDIYHELMRNLSFDIAKELREELGSTLEKVLPKPVKIEPIHVPEVEKVSIRDLFKRWSEFLKEKWLNRLKNILRNPRISVRNISVNQAKRDYALFKFIESKFSSTSYRTIRRDILSDADKSKIIQQIEKIKNDVNSLVASLEAIKIPVSLDPTMRFKTLPSDKEKLDQLQKILSDKLKEAHELEESVARKGTITNEDVSKAVNIVKTLKEEYSKANLDFPSDLVLLEEVLSQSKDWTITDIEDLVASLRVEVSNVADLIEEYQRRRQEDIKRLTDYIYRAFYTYFDFKSSTKSGQFNIEEALAQVKNLKKIVNDVEDRFADTEIITALKPIRHEIENLENILETIRESKRYRTEYVPKPGYDFSNVAPQYSAAKTRDKILEIVTDPYDREYVQAIYDVITMVTDRKVDISDLGERAIHILREFFDFAKKEGIIPGSSQASETDNKIFEKIRDMFTVPSTGSSDERAGFPKEPEEDLEYTFVIQDIGEGIATNIMNGDSLSPSMIEAQTREALESIDPDLKDYPLILEKVAGDVLKATRESLEDRVRYLVEVARFIDEKDLRRIIKSLKDFGASDLVFEVSKLKTL